MGQKSQHGGWSLPEDVAAVVAENPSLEDIAAGARSYLAEDASGHDMDHLWRVFILGVRIAKQEGADGRVVGAAALIHDIHRVMDGESFTHPRESLPIVREILDATSFPEQLIDDVCHCVKVHDEYDFRGVEYPAETLEAEVLRDADNLDAMGAVGVARCFAFGALAGNPLWLPDADEETHSGLDHFEDKLYELPDEMHTETAREIAADRCAFLETFEERFRKEWYGEF